MRWFYKNILRPALFRCDSEGVHDRVLAGLGCVSRTPWMLRSLAWMHDPGVGIPVETLGLLFPSPVGLAAGMDKRALAVPAWEALGFGFSELGGVTWLAQPGNPMPRMFRVVEERALINRMGFNNPGAEALAQSLKAWRQRGLWPRHPVGINLGKSKATPLEHAARDYADSFRSLEALADFFVVNVSSPNTPNLRQLQDKRLLDEILSALQEINGADGRPKRPILVKVAPDLGFEALDEILELVGPRNLAGLVATNTTITRPEARDEGQRRLYAEAGGLSGAPLRQRSTEVIRHLYKQTRGTVPIIGVGGVFTVEDAWEKVAAGATLIQVYSGMVYEGPAIAGIIVRGLAGRLKERGMRHWREAVGCEPRA